MSSRKWKNFLIILLARGCTAANIQSNQEMGSRTHRASHQKRQWGALRGAATCNHGGTSWPRNAASLVGCPVPPCDSSSVGTDQLIQSHQNNLPLLEAN